MKGMEGKDTDYLKKKDRKEEDKCMEREKGRRK